MSIPQSIVRQGACIIGLIGPTPDQAPTLTFRSEDEWTRTRVARDAMARRDLGETVYLHSHDERLLLAICDEVWWQKDGVTLVKGDPREVYGNYLSDVARRVREEAHGQQSPLVPALRRGDGRATLEALETLGADGEPTMVWRSGELAAIRVKVRFLAAVDDPVVGIMLRTRIGMEVYGTNTELEKVKLGPVEAGDARVVTFSFTCALCPNDYTITAASHDPDGVWHDWQEDAMAISVIDNRYTAGVANLRAQVIAVRG
ncbi:MAG: Wzt carbohydrate-binding domain-containing protein [Bryobacteraceae bacterium]|nr:Wzt carbohydrate-binding domain-containing protein [Bryobacteraceae bacterium]